VLEEKELTLIITEFSSSPSIRQVITSATDDATAFHQLISSQDWAGALELESKMSTIVNRSENKDPSYARMINLNLGAAHKQLGREGGIEKASLLACTTKKLSNWQRRRVIMR